MNRFLLIGCVFLLPVHAIALPRQDTLQPPLRSIKELDAWLEDPSRPKVRLHPVPLIATPVEPVLTSADRKHIGDLIAQLAEIDSPDYGLSSTMSGDSFAPVPGSESLEMAMMTAHDLKQSPAVLELVKLGPRALSFLLQRLDDVTPTKLTIKHDFVDGDMNFDHEIEFNEASPLERPTRIHAVETSPARLQHSLTTYQVKVGDVCFNIIGQIVGRRYLAVRYQPTACIVINSPVADTILAKEVRAVWTSRTPVKHLFRSLLTDYSCRPIYNGFSFDGWNTGHQLQCEAAMRLLYYFPTQTAVLIAQRLHQLRIERTGPAAEATDKWVTRELANGVRTGEFVQAVSWCSDPHIEAEIVAIVNRTGDAEVMAAAVRGIRSSRRKSLAPRIRAFLAAEPASQRTWSYGAELVLEALATWWGDDAKPFYVDYLRHGDIARAQTVCIALEGAHVDWDASVLVRLLADKRTIPGFLHAAGTGGNGQILTRVCDIAARALAHSRRSLKFDAQQSYEELDKEIATIKTQIELEDRTNPNP